MNRAAGLCPDRTVTTTVHLQELHLVVQNNKTHVHYLICSSERRTALTLRPTTVAQMWMARTYLASCVTRGLAPSPYICIMYLHRERAAGSTPPTHVLGAHALAADKPLGAYDTGHGVLCAPLCPRATVLRPKLQQSMECKHGLHSQVPNLQCCGLVWAAAAAAGAGTSQDMRSPAPASHTWLCASTLRHSVCMVSSPWCHQIVHVLGLPAH